MTNSIAKFFLPLFFFLLALSHTNGTVAFGQIWDSRDCEGLPITSQAGFQINTCQLATGTSSQSLITCQPSGIQISNFLDRNCQVLNETIFFATGQCFPFGVSSSARVEGCQDQLPEGTPNIATIDSFSSLDCSGDLTRRLLLSDECLPFQNQSFSRTLCTRSGPTTFWFSDAECTQNLIDQPRPLGCDRTSGEFFRCGFEANTASLMTLSLFPVSLFLLLII